MYFLWDFLVDIWDYIIIYSGSLRQWKRNERNRIRYYVTASAEDVNGMPDVEVLAVAWYQLTVKHKIHKARSLSELMRYNAVQRIFWVIDVYEQKIDGGGLLGFLSSDYGYLAPLVAFALEAVGAYEHMELYNEYIRKYGIDFADLSAFELTGLKGKKRKAKQAELLQTYDFSEFDEKYLSLEPLGEFLTPFVRDNAKELLESPIENG